MSHPWASLIYVKVSAIYSGVAKIHSEVSVIYSVEISFRNIDSFNYALDNLGICS